MHWDEVDKRERLAEWLIQPEQLSAIATGQARIPGLTWHHAEDGVTLQLVDRQTHRATGYAGGRQATGGRP